MITFDNLANTIASDFCPVFNFYCNDQFLHLLIIILLLLYTY